MKEKFGDREGEKTNSRCDFQAVIVSAACVQVKPLQQEGH